MVMYGLQHNFETDRIVTFLKTNANSNIVDIFVQLNNFRKLTFPSFDDI